jgi:ribonuclease HI
VHRQHSLLPGERRLFWRDPVNVKPIGHQDNNVAEYLALLEALQCAVDLGAKTLHVFSHSHVVVKQMTGEYTCRSTQLYSLNWTCRKLARSLEFSISHVTRENIMLKPTAWLTRRHARRVDKNIECASYCCMRLASCASRLFPVSK